MEENLCECKVCQCEVFRHGHRFEKNPCAQQICECRITTICSCEKKKLSPIECPPTNPGQMSPDQSPSKRSPGKQRRPMDLSNPKQTCLLRFKGNVTQVKWSDLEEKMKEHKETFDFLKNVNLQEIQKYETFNGDEPDILTMILDACQMIVNQGGKPLICNSFLFESANDTNNFKKDLIEFIKDPKFLEKLRAKEGKFLNQETYNNLSQFVNNKGQFDLKQVRRFTDGWGYLMLWVEAQVHYHEIGRVLQAQNPDQEQPLLELNAQATEEPENAKEDLKASFERELKFITKADIRELKS